MYDSKVARQAMEQGYEVDEQAGTVQRGSPAADAGRACLSEPSEVNVDQTGAQVTYL